MLTHHQHIYQPCTQVVYLHDDGAILTVCSACNYIIAVLSVRKTHGTRPLHIRVSRPKISDSPWAIERWLAFCQRRCDFDILRSTVQWNTYKYADAYYRIQILLITCVFFFQEELFLERKLKGYYAIIERGRHFCRLTDTRIWRCTQLIWNLCFYHITWLSLDVTLFVYCCTTLTSINEKSQHR